MHTEKFMVIVEYENKIKDSYDANSFSVENGTFSIGLAKPLLKKQRPWETFKSLTDTIEIAFDGVKVIEIWR